MPTILDLPREVRDLIYMTVLASELSPPSSPTESRHDRKELSQSSFDDDYFSEQCNHYPLQPLPIPSSTLLLTNHQVRTETRDAISRLKAHKQLRYKIDCMIEDEMRIYPTWVSIPALSSHIDTVEVDFRLFGNRNGKSGFYPGDGGPGIMIWSLLALLHRFLERGPDFLSPRKVGRKIGVGVIVLNVMTPTEPAEGFLPKNGLGRLTETGLVHPETILESIGNEMGYLLATLRYSAEYARIVFERVGRIRLTLDGETRREWDLVAMDSQGS